MSPPATAPDVEAFRLMSAARFADALPFAQRAVKGSTVCQPAHGMLATLLLQLGRASEADGVVRDALRLAPGSADAYDALAHVSLLLGEHQRSNELYRRAAELAPRDPRFWYNLASSERSLGRLLAAEEACARAIALDPAHYASYLLRSELRVQANDDNHIAELGAQLARTDLPERARVLLGYALGKELDDVQRFDQAFACFDAAARARRRQLAYDVGVDEHKLGRIAEVFPPEARHAETVSGDFSRYIFIVGLPRSGTTLLEHMLTGLPAVRSNGETDNFARALMAASPAGTQDLFERAAAANPNRTAENYVRLADHGSAASHIIEKLPMNYLYLGAIRRALPTARILLVRRQPLDSCFAMYRTLFGAAYPFSYDFEDLARYYAAYERLIEHWRASLGDRLFEVEYEALVSDPQSTGARVARHCGLTWRPEAVEVHRSASVSLTASAAQIRRPIYGSSSGRWRRYRMHLEPLVRALRRCGVALPEDA